MQPKAQPPKRIVAKLDRARGNAAGPHRPRGDRREKGSRSQRRDFHIREDLG